MRDAETVTFGGSGLDRAAHLRGDEAALDTLWKDPKAQVLLLWRGKPLTENDDLALLPSAHPILADRQPAAVFLGLENEAGLFAVDISDWEPDALPESLNGFFDPSAQQHPDLPNGVVFRELRGIMAGLTPRHAELAATSKAIVEWHRTHRFCALCGGRNRLSMAGWQATCTDCGAHHFPRTDPVVIMLITNGNSVLMGRSPGWPQGMYSLLAGFVEPGETIEGAVRREVLEESGIQVGDVAYLASQPWPFPASLMFGCRGHATSTEIKIDPAEIEDARWFSREEMLEIMAGEHKDVTPARKGAIAHFLIRNWLADTLE
ncbi:NUDIX hydrolase [Actibacterium mucosum KCTC 23349]|uniref:NAD(+) diphosphatase n=1 Tax=Actibacterium mucosum KCTC 23349 TaxID=1454373 RepID=A0A037ZEM6_9RHOB|nr:NAD(+) diphosphatase [Actibacterium mucosum]KAJ54900.1 NUDIX hydrolase [Actibacterium mucosum KCTC 23349]